MPRPPATKVVILKQAVWVWEDGARRPPSYYDVPCRFGFEAPLLQDETEQTQVRRANSSRTVASVPRPPTTSEAIYSPLQRGRALKK